MPRLGGNLFEGVAFPVVFGDRFVSVNQDALTGALLVDVYRWDRDRDRLVVELFQGRPLAGAPPLTVTPIGGAGAVRLGVDSAAGDVVGYLSGGSDPRSIIVSPERIELLEGDRQIFTMIGGSVIGCPVGIVVSEDGVGIGAGLPSGLPDRRLFLGSSVVLTDLAPLSPPVIAQAEFEDCRLIGPAIVASIGPISLVECSLPSGHFIWELPATTGEINGVIGLSECHFLRCTFENVGLAVPPGERESVYARLRGG